MSDRRDRGILAIAFLAIACTEETAPADGAPKSGATSSPKVITRLLDGFEAAQVESDWKPLELRRDGATAGLEPVLEADFESPAAGMHVYPFGRPFQAAPPAGAVLPAPLPPTVTAEAAADGDAGLRFPEASGGALWWIPVQPDTPYQVDVDVRRLAAAGQAPAGVGTTLLIELVEPPDLAAHDGDIWTALGSLTWASQHKLEVTENNVFQHQSVVFRSTVFTRALVIFLVAGDPGWWLDEAKDADRAFAVDFDGLRVHQLPLQRYLAVQDRSVQDDVRSFQELPGDGAATSAWFLRKVKLVGDVRRSVLAPPTTRVRFPLTLPRGRYRLSLSYGVMHEQREAPAPPVRFRAWLEHDGTAIGPTLDRTLEPRQDMDLGWQDFVAEGEADGQAVEVVLETAAVTATGATPASNVVAVFGEPALVPLDRPRPPNLILLSVDTLRADHLGCYGYQRPDGKATSPNLDRLAADALLFEEARTVAPYTLPSHATMMTGLLPRVHGVERVGRRIASGVHPILAEALAEAGYATAAFTGGGFVSHEHGFHHGFDRYSILDPMISPEDPLRNDFPFPADRARNDAFYQRTGMDAVHRWVEQQDGAPFFLFLHTFLVHNYHAQKPREREFVRSDPTGFLTSDRALHPIDLQYAAGDEPVPEELLATLRDVYDATIHEFDAHLGRLIAFLEDRGLWENTVLILTSDHGEEFGEHRGLLHGRTLYEEVLRVPLLLWSPGAGSLRVTEPVDLTDVAPTLLAAAGLSPFPVGNGEDLITRIQTGQYPETLWAEVSAPNLSERTACLRQGRKLLHNPDSAREEPGYEKRRPPEWEVYDLARDPGERTNIWLTPERVAEPLPALRGLQRLHQQVGQELRRQHREIVPDPLQMEGALSPDQRRKLEELGYVLDGR